MVNLSGRGDKDLDSVAKHLGASRGCGFTPGGTAWPGRAAPAGHWSSSALVHILYFLQARLFIEGAPITTREWLYCVGTLVLIVLGTINIRMAEMLERRQGTLPLVDPNLRSRK